MQKIMEQTSFLLILKIIFNMRGGNAAEAARRHTFRDRRQRDAQARPGFSRLLGNVPGVFSGECMFQKEEECIEQAEELLSSLLRGTVAEKPFGDLLDVSRKLLRQSRRLVTMGDRMQAQLSSLNDELTHMARTDALTGLDNRRQFMEVARKELSRSRRTGKPFSLLLIDADHFKSINDTWGHDVGDRVLRDIASLLNGAVRAHDMPARIGGEEFAVLLPETDCREAALLAERIRLAMERHIMLVEQAAVRFSVCIGCTTGSGQEKGLDLEVMLKRADVALYAAKKNGRNRVERYPGPDCLPDCPVAAAERVRHQGEA